MCIGPRRRPGARHLAAVLSSHAGPSAHRGGNIRGKKGVSLEMPERPMAGRRPTHTHGMHTLVKVGVQATLVSGYALSCVYAHTALRTDEMGIYGVEDMKGHEAG